MGSEVVTRDGFRLYYHKAEQKKYQPTIILVHHMWGNHKTTWRHFRYLNEKGFDCITFDLVFGSSKLGLADLHPVMKYFYKGVFYIWTRQIRSVLNEIEGDKIVFAFSGPSLSAFWACSGRSDILKFICDGGPFDQIYKNTKNFFYHEMGIKNKYLNKLAAFFGSAIWGVGPIKKLHQVLNFWAKAVPILSVRGLRDHIVDPDSIRMIFSAHNNLNITELELQHGKHLDGLRDFPDEYRKTLFPFLKKDLDPIKPS